MPRAKARKFYAVRVGRAPGIYYDWEDAQKQINGFPGAMFKSFKSEPEATTYLNEPFFKPGWKIVKPTKRADRSVDATPSSSTSMPSSSLDVIDLSFESDGEIVVDMTLDEAMNSSPVKPEPRPPHSWRARRGQVTRASFGRAPDPSAMELDKEDYSPRQPRVFSHDPLPPQDVPDDEPQQSLDPPLSPQQQEILKRCMEGANIFFTGSAGTGKSVLLRALIKALKGQVRVGNIRGGDDARAAEVAITASTGMAALNIGGCTLHSWAGIGLGNGTVEKLVKFMNSFARKRWHKTTTLLVDEVSMLHGDLLDKLDKIGRRVRGVEKPFGGIQIIFCGDFLQLPPVSKGGPVSYAFDSNVWDKLFPRSNMVTLMNVFRQSDMTFVDCLENMRRGVVSDEHDALLRSLDRPLNISDGIRPVSLYSRRIDVERENINNLKAIESPTEQYDAVDRAHPTEGGRQLADHEATDLLNDRSRWPENLPLKVGAQVMLVTNWMPGLVNGSTGIVTAFMTCEEGTAAGIMIPPEFNWTLPERKYPVVKFNSHRNAPTRYPEILVPRMTVTAENANQEVEASREQVPLILAWAITIHKSQGLTLDKVRVDLQGAFDCGQAYVALSRATSLEGLEVRRYARSKIMTSQRVLEWTREMAEDEEWDEILSTQVVFDY